MKQKIIITGCKNFHNYEQFIQNTKWILDLHDNNIEIISGGEGGTDALVEKFAQKHSLKLKIFSTDWNKHGKSAEYTKNKQMVKYANKNESLIVFWDGKSKEIMHIMSLAEKYGLNIYTIRIDDNK